jgi:hypothetical protein
MEQTLERLVTLTERVLLHVERGIPPEAEVLQALREAIHEVRERSGIRTGADGERPQTYQVSHRSAHRP